MPFEHREHTSETWIVATGMTLEEAFSDGGKALFDVMVPIKQIEQITEFEIVVSSDSLEQLFFEWLNKLILVKDVESLLFSEFKIESIEFNALQYELKARAFGEEYDSEKHEASVDVKATTFSELVCKKTDIGYEVGCVLDI
jgi:SHS2 domain-containing protein